MKTKLLKIAKDLKKGTITKKEAKALLLCLLNISDCSLKKNKLIMDNTICPNEDKWGHRGE